MALDTNQLNRLMGAARARDVSKVEELWIDLQGSEDSLNELPTFLQVAREVASRGDEEKAAELLLLLREDLRAAGRDEDLFHVLRLAVGYSGRVQGVRNDLIGQFRRVYGDRAGLEGILSRTGLATEGDIQSAVRALDEAFHFAVGEFVFHARGWGIGKVVEAHPETGEFVIDFARRRGQRMEAGMALSALEKRASDDLDVLLWTDKEAIRTLATEDPLGLLKKALRTEGGKVQSRLLKTKLADVLEKTAWTKFWAAARKEAKNDPQIEVGDPPRSIITLRDEPVAREVEVVQQIKRGKDFKARLQTARRELLATKRDGTPDTGPPWLEESLKLLNKNHGKIGTSEQRAARLELELFRAEVAGSFPAAVPDVQLGDANAVDPDTGEPLPAQAPSNVQKALDGLAGDKLPPVLKAMCINEHRRRLVALLPAAFDAKTAVETLTSVMLDPASQTWIASMEALKGIGRDDAILDAVTRTLIKPHDYPEAVAAFARARLTGGLNMFPDRTDTEILAKAIQVLDTVSLEFKGTTDRQKKAELKPIVEGLRALFSERNQRVLEHVIGGGTEGQVRRILQLVRQSPSLTGTIKRAAEKFVVRMHPEVLAKMKTGPEKPATETTSTLYSTLEGRRRREAELHDIVDNKLEEVRLEIGRALEFGDISENAELDAARERQQRLAEQVERIRSELERVAIIDPSKVDTDAVRVGTRVEVLNLETNQVERYTILGPWDIDDGDDIISHLSALAQGLMGAAVGDTCKVTLPTGKTVDYKVNSIERAVLQQT